MFILETNPVIISKNEIKHRIDSVATEPIITYVSGPDKSSLCNLNELRKTTAIIIPPKRNIEDIEMEINNNLKKSSLSVSSG